MKPLNFSKTHLILTVGIITGFITLATLAVIIINDAEAAAVLGFVGLFCSSLSLFIMSSANSKGHGCEKK